MRYCIFCFYIYSYSLSSSAYLNVDPDTGSVTVKADISYSRQQQIFATVRAEDTAVPPHFDVAQIVVDVIDINDMRPVLVMVRNLFITQGSDTIFNGNIVILFVTS